VGYETVDGQDANQIDLPTIQAAIKAKFTAPAPSSGGASAAGSKPAKKAAPIPAASTVTVDVYNGGSTGGLAGDVSAALVAKGYRAGAVTDASAQSQTVETGSEVFYGAGASANAARIAGYFGVTAAALGSLPAGHVEVLLGTGSSIVPAGLGQAAASPTATPSAGSAAGDNGAAGSAVTVAPNAKFGIPCVY
jgi:hypothetical protein